MPTNTPTSIASCVLAAAIGAAAPSTRLTIDPKYWALDIPIVSLEQPKGVAIVDTAGFTESKKLHPRNFATYYHGLPIDFAIGPDYLNVHRLELGTLEGNAWTVTLDVQTRNGQTFAFASCTIGESRFRLLLDTAALAWTSSDSDRAFPFGVVFLTSQSFANLRRSEPSWVYRPNGVQIMSESGRFVDEPAVEAPKITCGDLTTTNVDVVERSDSTTYDWFANKFGQPIAGDASLAAFRGNGVVINLPAMQLNVYR